MAEDNPNEGEQPKGFKGYRLTKAEKSGRARTDFSNWRKKLQAAKVKFDDVQKGIFLNTYAKTGRKQQAASAAGTTLETVNRHRETDTEFANAYDEATLAYQDKVHTLAYKLMDGIREPIVGGKDKDQIVAHKLVHATNLLAMEMRRSNPEYKERQELELKGGGGVLLVPETATSVDDYVAKELARTANKTMPGAEEEPSK